VPSSENDSRSSLLASIGGQVEGNNSDTDYNPEDDDYSEADPAPVDEQYDLVNRAVACENNASEVVQVNRYLSSKPALEFKYVEATPGWERADFR